MSDTLTFDKENHLYRLNDIPMAGVSSILKRAGLIDLSGIPKEALERAGQFGSAVHVACELYDKGTLDMSTVDISLIPYLEAWIKFTKTMQVQILKIEQPVYSKRYWYAGTLDRIATIQGKLSIIDIKSSATIYPSMKIQLAAYKVAYDEMNAEKIKERIIVQLLKTGEFKIEPCKDESDMNTFLCAVVVSKWIRKNLKKEENNEQQPSINA
jgi:hypothetical protein